MIPLHLTISGFLSYRDPVDLDFRAIDLACISGHNGAGKSSLLDAITWALFGEARKRDDSLINAQSAAAEVRLEIAYEGGIYAVQRSKMRDKPTQLAFLLQTANGSWKNLTEKSVRETDAAIQRILRMDYETFINASFFLQGKADQFATQRPADRKRILASILGLEVWEAYREKALAKRRLQEAEINRIDGQVREINAELSEEPQRMERLAMLRKQLAEAESARSAQEQSFASLQKLQASLSEQERLISRMETGLRSRRIELQETQQRLAARREEQTAHRLVLQREEQIRKEFAIWQQLRQQLEEWEAVAERFRESEKRRNEPLRQIESAHAALEQELKGLQTEMIAIAQRLEVLPNLKTERSTALLELKQCEGRIEYLTGLQNELEELTPRSAQARVENQSLKAEMDRIKARIDSLSEAKGEVNCPLCGQPLSEGDRLALLAALEAEGKAMGGRYRENSRFLKEFEARVSAIQQELLAVKAAEDALRAQARKFDQLDHRIGQMEAEITQWETDRQPRLEEISMLLEKNRYAVEARTNLERIDAELKEIGYDAAAHDQLRRSEQAKRESEASIRLLDAAIAALEPLEREIGDLVAIEAKLLEQIAKDQAEYDQSFAAYQKTAASLPDMNHLERQVFELRERENRLRAELGRAQQMVDVLDSLRARQKALEIEREEAGVLVGRYKTLERAFSQQGVPALLIEQALPEIETHANQFLERLSGGEMTVRILTQREFKDKNREDKRETLDILISDSNGTRDYEMFSGGEAFRVNFAIRLALSQVLARRAGARLQTLVIDEGFGSQDALGRNRLIEAIHLVQPEFAKILVITHLEELKDHFPTRIEVEKGERGSMIRVI